GDDTMDDVQSKPRRAMVTSRGEERIESGVLDVRRHSAAVVGHDELDLIITRRSQIDTDLTSGTIRPCMGHGIHDQMGQNLPEGTGIAVHFETSREAQIECDTAAMAFAIEMRQQLLRQFGSVEAAQR